MKCISQRLSIHSAFNMALCLKLNHGYVSAVMLVICPYRNTLYVLKLDVAQRNQTVVFVVFLWQLQNLSGFTPLAVIKTHRPREVDEDLHYLRSLGWGEEKTKEAGEERRGSQMQGVEFKILVVRELIIFITICPDEGFRFMTEVKSSTKNLTKIWGL